MEKKIFDKLLEAIDKVRDEYLENHLVIFQNESERKRKLYFSSEAMRAKWSKKQSCIVDGCCNKSIVRSHTIQKSGPIATVAIDSVVLTPTFNLETGNMLLKNRGINDASVFPGFCQEHEKMFHSFEETKDLHSTEAVILQLYRTICRELFRLETQIEILTKLKNEYIKFRDEKFLDLIKNELTKEWIRENNINLESIKLKDDPYLELCENPLNGIIEIHNKVKNDHLKNLEELIKDKKINDMDNIYPFVVDVVIPATLSGLGTFYIDEKTKVTVFMGVYPNSEKQETCIILYSNEEDKPYLKQYFEYFSSYPFGILNMIEQFMIRGTDHWFINPEIWNKKSENQKNIILSEMLDYKKGITQPLEFSIFDDVRQEIINYAHGENLTEIETKYLNLEKHKLERS